MVRTRSRYVEIPAIRSGLARPIRAYITFIRGRIRGPIRGRLTRHGTPSMIHRVRPVNDRTYAVVWSPCLFAFGRAGLLLFFVPNFRRRRKLGTKSESLPRGRRRQRRGGGTTAYLLSLTRRTRWVICRPFSPTAARYYFSKLSSLKGAIPRLKPEPRFTIELGLL